MVFQEELINSLKKAEENIAIEYKENSITYSDVLNKSNRITKFLLDKGLASQACVGILLDDKVDLIYSMIGIVNAKCVFVPIDRKLPEDRLNKIYEELGLEYVITSESLKDYSNSIVNQYTIENIFGDDDINIDFQYPEYAVDDSIYVYFTSGSTGNPKGIIGKNCSLIQFLKWQINAFDIDESCRVSQLISPYFDAFLRDVFVPLLVGGTICIPPQSEDFFSPDKISNWIDESEITLIHCVPSVFRTFSQYSELSKDYFKNLKYVFLSGEKIIPSELKKWYAIFESTIQLVNFYGTTETTMIRSYYLIKPEDSTKKRIPIGSPIADTELLILDKDLKPVKALMTGDLYIVTEYMTKGYLNNPKLTNEKFVLLNEGTDEEKSAFRTGDKGRILPNKLIELLGREDRQVKLRGIRIELDEIENVLLKSEYLKNIFVIKQEENVTAKAEVGDDNETNELLIAFIIKDDKHEKSALFQEKLEAYAKNHLAEYMIPSKFIQVNEFPLLRNGKIDYKKLQSKIQSDVSEIVSPKNDIEEKLLAIWKEILGEKTISTEDSFHRIGGNSLSIMRLIAKIYTEFKIRISLSELFKTLTIKSQASYIKNATQDNRLKISKALEKPLYALSSSQKRMYFNYELNKNSTSYNLSIVFQINNSVDVNKIEEIFFQLTKKHETLRTIFKIEGETLFQEIKEPEQVHIEQLYTKDIDQSILEFVKPFNLNEGPLFRVCLINTEEDQKFLAFDIHHIICDGISQINLFSDFLTLYNNKTLEQLEFQYKDYAEWENEFKNTPDYIRQREFWLTAFERDIPKLELPTSNVNTSQNSDQGGSIAFEIPNQTIKPLINSLKEDDNTDFSILYSLFVTFLVQLTGQDDIVIGIASSGRIQEEVEDLIGMFSKTLPIRSRVDLNSTFRNVVKEINSYLIEATSKQTYDLSDILVEANKKTKEHIKNLFDVMFIYQNFDRKKLDTLDNDFTYYDFENNTTKYPISLFAIEEEDVYSFKFEYSSEFFTKADIEVLISQFKELIVSISENVNTEVIDIIGNSSDTLESVEDDLTFNF